MSKRRSRMSVTMTEKPVSNCSLQPRCCIESGFASGSFAMIPPFSRRWQSGEKGTRLPLSISSRPLK